MKMESRLQEVLHKFELEAKQQHGDFATQYSQMSPEDGPKVGETYHLWDLFCFKVQVLSA